MARLLICCVLAALCLVATAPPASAAPIPDDFYAVYGEDVFTNDPELRAQKFAQLRQLGATTVRIPFDWRRLEQWKDEFTYGDFDEFIAAAADAGIRILPTLVQSPIWAAPAAEWRSWREIWPPDHPEDMARLAIRLVNRYGPNGELWRKRPKVRALPIRIWQVWNEPNLLGHWHPQPDPQAYTNLLRVVGGAIKATDPGATIVAAGLPWTRRGEVADVFLERLYRLGANQAWDAVAVHPYSRDADGTLSLVRLARATMDRNGDAAKPLWVTEFGWGTNAPPSPWSTTEGGQRERITRALGLFHQQREELGLRSLVYYSYSDGRPYPIDSWAARSGLRRLDGSAKPSFHAFREAISSARVVNGTTTAGPARLRTKRLIGIRLPRGKRIRVATTRRTRSKSPTRTVTVRLACRRTASRACTGGISLHLTGPRMDGTLRTFPAGYARFRIRPGRTRPVKLVLGGIGDYAEATINPPLGGELAVSGVDRRGRRIAAVRSFTLLPEARGRRR